MIRIGDFYIPLHTITQVTFGEKYARVWTEHGYFYIEAESDVERLRAWLETQVVLALPETKFRFDD